VLASGFWSLIAERFDPAGARAAYGRISAAGTAGGIVGSFAAERIATIVSPAAVLVMLTTLHVLCGVGALLLRRSPALLSRPPGPERSASVVDTFGLPYIRTIAAFVVLTSTASAILDFLLKAHARESFGTGPELLRFFALFYGALQVLTFLTQTRSAQTLQRLGVSRTINSLAGGVAGGSIVALLVPGWPVFTALRAVEAVLHNSLFRSGYELLFVPMDAGTRRRAKTVLDVLCDRVGDAAGSGIVQLVLLAGVAAPASSLLSAVLVLAAASLWLGQRFGPLYLGLIQDQLLRFQEAPQVSMISEAGWTLLSVPAAPELKRPQEPAPLRAASVLLDPAMQMLAELRSDDASRVIAALSGGPLERLHVAQLIDLLARDDVLPAARAALDRVGPEHQGMLIDALLDPSTEFASRRRLPRILGTVASQRTLDGLVSGLDDPRFEVRYHCSRAIDRLLARNRGLMVPPARIIAVIERELAIPPQKWRGYRLLDRPEQDDRSEPAGPEEDSSRYLEYVRLLLSTIVPREPFGAAVHAVRSANPGVRGLAFEYLEQVVPPAVLERLKALIASTPSGAGVPSQSDGPPPSTGSSAPR
jgi:hypothetical protein